MKFLILNIVILRLCYKFFLNRLSSMWTKMPLNDNVKGIYDTDRYNTFIAYKKANNTIGLLSEFVTTILSLVLLITNAYAYIANLSNNVYVSTILCIIIFNLMEYPFSLIFNIIDTFVIDNKYGFNNTTVKTFIIDQIKDILISNILMIILMCGLIFFIEKFSYTGLIIAFIILIILIVLLNLFSTNFMMIFNKFTPLDNKELEQGLYDLCKQYNVTLKGIYVINESLRSNRINAFCTGLGNTKKIVLYDNLLKEMTNDEIVAIFAHELAHAHYHHSYYLLCSSVVAIGAMFVMLMITLHNPSWYVAFGFSDINYYFTITLVMYLLMPLSLIYSIFTNWLSRTFEYQADGFAASLGYGETLKVALKKLSYHELVNLNPCPLIITLEYNHPSLSQRLTAIDKKIKVN